MLINNIKFGLGFILSVCLHNSGYSSSEPEFTFKPARVVVGARSIAASSARTTMSRREANLTKPIIYDGAVEELYHPICSAIFQSKKYVTSEECKKMLGSIIFPSDINDWNPQSAERVRNVVTDAGIHLLQDSIRSGHTKYLATRTVNFMNFLLRSEFAKSDFSWQDSFAKVVGNEQSSMFFSLVDSNPSEVVSNALFKVWNELFLGDNGVMCRYASKRQSETDRANTFVLFEKLFNETVSDRSIKLLEANLQKEREERALAEKIRKESDSRIAAENAARDKKHKELEETLARLEAAQRSQSNQSQQRSGTGCVMQ